ncbi:MAG: alpha/beta fold hydrolase [Hyellaceae cyanobacterium CSU_1_1]|nr:alpha/beta fold hydrolase [Hyellaceae cyanobacterium CSU_1_1]
MVKELEDLFEYKDTTQKAIALESERKIAQSKVNVEDLPDLSQPGKYRVRRRQVTFSIDSPRQTAKGFTGDYKLNVEVHSPIGLNEPAPLAIIAHGFGAKSSDYDELAKHLASYGYIVAMPEHDGSNTNYQDAFLRGEVGVDISPVEFYSRPRDITHLLNKLERDPDWQPQINWSEVGIIGHSLGGTTALLAAGAALNWDRIQSVCQQDDFVFNVSIFLQCRAKKFTPRKL